MSSAAANLNPADPADQNGEDAQYYRQVLHELIDMGIDLARAIHQQGTAQANPADRTDNPAASVPAASGPGRDRVAARRRIIREVEDVIQRTYGADAEALQAELSERLDGPELEDEIDGRPVADIIADICRDLGVAVTLGAHPWKRRMPREIEALCARAAPSCAAPASIVAHAPRDRGETGADPPSSPRDAGADLLRFTFPLRGT